MSTGRLLIEVCDCYLDRYGNESFFNNEFIYSYKYLNNDIEEQGFVMFSISGTSPTLAAHDASGKVIALNVFYCHKELYRFIDKVSNSPEFICWSNPKFIKKITNFCLQQISLKND